MILYSQSQRQDQSGWPNHRTRSLSCHGVQPTPCMFTSSDPQAFQQLVADLGLQGSLTSPESVL